MRIVGFHIVTYVAAMLVYRTIGKKSWEFYSIIMQNYLFAWKSLQDITINYCESGYELSKTTIRARSQAIIDSKDLGICANHFWVK